MSSNPEIGSLNRTRAIMKEYGIHAKKGFGQNFLTDLNVLKNIVKAAAITKEDNVIEIGPGLGALTEQLAQAAGQVVLESIRIVPGLMRCFLRTTMLKCSTKTY